MIKYEDIENVNEKLKTTDIKGKDYVEVNQRVKAFRMLYPEGIIDNRLASNIAGVCVFKAQVGYYEEDGCVRWLATGYAYEKEDSTFINKTSYIENCETSAVGRALGMLSLGIGTSIASAEEVVNAINNQNITKEDAENYVLDFGKHAGLKLAELPSSYLHWLYENNANCKQMIDLLGLIQSDDEIIESTIIIQDIMKLIDETGLDLDKIKEKYKIDSLSGTEVSVLKTIKNKLEKLKETKAKVVAENE